MSGKLEELGLRIQAYAAAPFLSVKSQSVCLAARCPLCAMHRSSSTPCLSSLSIMRCLLRYLILWGNPPGAGVENPRCAERPRCLPSKPSLRSAVKTAVMHDQQQQYIPAVRSYKQAVSLLREMIAGT